MSYNHQHDVTNDLLADIAKSLRQLAEYAAPLYLEYHVDAPGEPIDWAETPAARPVVTP
ncbi:MAG: hypothetical protein ACRCYU_12380 [Nocardioides sp.]